LILTAISAVGTLGAAIGSFLSAWSTRRTSEGTLFAIHYKEYGSPEMLRSLRVLRMWKFDQGDEFGPKWKKLLDAGNPKGQEVDAARRQVKFYFMEALRLYQAGYASRKFLQELASVDGINILYDIVEPLEYALNPRFDSSKFDLLRKLVGRVGTKTLIAPVPPTPIESKDKTDVFLKEGKMAVYFRCKNCGKDHRSPIDFGDRRSFDTATLSNNHFQCPITRQMATYDKKDMFWKEDSQQ